MAKDDLISQGLWGRYSRKVRDRMNGPRHFGTISEEDARQRGLKLVDVVHGAVSCGDAVELFWLVDASGVIREARFKTFGCGTAIAASDMMAELCLGKHVEEAMKITNLDVEHALRDDPGVPAVPGQKMHCSVMAYDVIRKAAAAWSGRPFDEVEEEIVCPCARVSRATVEDAIRLNDLHTVEEITRYTKAGGYCGSCIRAGGHEDRPVYLEDILRRVRAEMDRERGAPSFAALPLVEKLRLVEDAVRAEIAPALAADGGGLTVAGINGSEVSVRYTGACAGCAGAAQGTLLFVQDVLRKLDPAISVVLARE